MFIIPTKTKLKRQTNDSLGKPIITGSASKAELEAAARRHGWTRRELSVKEIREMSSGECRYHEVCNPDLFEAAFQRQANIDHNDREMDKVAVQRMFEDRATPEETAAAVEQTRRFSARFPQGQFATVPENRTKLIGWLRDRNLPITFDNLAAGFAELAMAGDLVLSAAVLGDDRQLSGQVLRTYSRLHELIQPHHMPTAEEKMSANDYWQAHQELHTKQIPPMVVEGFERAERTFRSTHPEYIATKNSRDRILAQLQEWKLTISPQSLEAAWKHLVEKGELQVDKTKVLQGQAVRITDLGGRR